MKRLVFLAGALMLAACTPPAPIENASPTPTPTASATATPCPTALDGTLADEKGMYAAEALYNVPAYAYVVADDNKVMTPALEAKAQPYLIEAYKQLKRVRSAYKAGNSCDFYAAYNALKSLSVAAAAILPKPKGN